MEISRTKDEAAILTLIVFVLGVLLGVLGNHVWGARVWGHQPPPLSHQIANDLAQELQLSANQQKQLSAILDDTRAQIRAAYAPADAIREQLRQQGRARVRAILTPDQLPKFEDFMHCIDEQRKKRDERLLPH